MNEMIERVARELFKHYTQGDIFYIGEWKEGARAVIEAMREPTEEMLLQGRVALGAEGMIEDSRCCWDAMIDAALAKLEDTK